MGRADLRAKGILAPFLRVEILVSEALNERTKHRKSAEELVRSFERVRGRDAPIRTVPLIDRVQFLLPVSSVRTESFRETLRTSSDAGVVVPAFACGSEREGGKEGQLRPLVRPFVRSELVSSRPPLLATETNIPLL